MKRDLDRAFNIAGFLTELSPEIVDYDKYTDKDIILKMAQKDSSEIIKRTLKEGKQVLEMEPFPWEWVAETYYGGVYDTTKGKWVFDDPDLYKKWLKDMLQILEGEAKKQRKL